MNSNRAEQFGNSPLEILSNQTLEMQNPIYTVDEILGNLTRGEEPGRLGSRVEVHRLSLTHFSEVRLAKLLELQFYHHKLQFSLYLIPFPTNKEMTPMFHPRKHYYSTKIWKLWDSCFPKKNIQYTPKEKNIDYISRLYLFVLVLQF